MAERCTHLPDGSMRCDVEGCKLGDSVARLSSRERLKGPRRWKNRGAAHTEPSLPCRRARCLASNSPLLAAAGKPCLPAARIDGIAVGAALERARSLKA